MKQMIQTMNKEVIYLINNNNKITINFNIIKIISSTALS